MINEFTYNGISSKSMHLVVKQLTVFDAPERDVEEIEIPGKNGSLMIDNGRYKNKEIGYHISSMDFSKIDEVKSWLKKSVSYHRLEDSYSSNVYMMACMNESIEFDKIIVNRFFSADINLNRKPQRFLVSGETPFEYSESGSINNPTSFDSKPLIRVYGSGNLTINGCLMSITVGSEYTDIDCETMDAFEGQENRNNNVVLKNFPVLSAGDNNVTVGSGITRIVVTPRWWKL